MITVTNAVDTAKVLISGDIGESFWGDGFTFANFKEQITGDYSNIEIEIKSNGGDGFEALAIYDELKNSPAKVKVKIVGSTASAGTIIAMGGDEIEITENSSFLIHRGSTIAMGNIDDLEKAADMLEQFDNKLLNIYQKRTGKRKTQIENLMKEDRWLKASEAIEWGFADKMTKPKKSILNKSDMDTTKIKEILLEGLFRVVFMDCLLVWANHVLIRLQKINIVACFDVSCYAISPCYQGFLIW